MKINILARMHNEGLIYCLNKWQGAQRREDIPKLVESLVKEFCESNEIDFEPFRLPTFTDNLDDLNLINWINQTTFSDDFKRLVNTTIDILQQNLDISSTFIELDSLLTQAESTLVKNEFTVFDDHIYVAKRSIEFWQSEVNGVILWKLNAPYLKNLPTRGPINWGKVFCCDCVGGIVGGAAGYLGSSLISVIMQY